LVSIIAELIRAHRPVRRSGELKDEVVGGSNRVVGCTWQSIHARNEEMIMANKEVVICSPVRTAIGTYGGTLKDMTAVDLDALAVRATLDRGKLDGQTIPLPDHLNAPLP
jgi:hypothetical protein